MSRYIDAEKLIEDIEKNHVSAWAFQHWIHIQPTADVKPVVKGKWLKEINCNYSPFDGTDGYIYICDQCNKRFLHKKNFCSNCGADMGVMEGGDSFGIQMDRS